MVCFKGKWLDSGNFRTYRQPLGISTIILCGLLVVLRSCRHNTTIAVLLFIPVLVCAMLALYYFIRSRKQGVLGKVSFDESSLTFTSSKSHSEVYPVNGLKSLHITQHTYTGGDESGKGLRNQFTGNNFVDVCGTNGDIVRREFSIESLYMEKKLQALMDIWRSKGLSVSWSESAGLFE